MVLERWRLLHGQPGVRRRPGREGAWVRCPASRRLWACTGGRRQGQGNFLGRAGSP